MIRNIKKFIISWQFVFSISLLAISFILFYIHYFIFHDLHHILIYTIHDIAFVPIEVLLVTLIIHKVLERRARKEKLNKLNMVIGAFFSEVGSELISKCVMLSPASQNLGAADAFFSDDNLKKISKLLVNKGFDVKDISEDNIIDLQEFLVAKRSFLLGLLENQNLLEHDAFTDLLWAVFHLTEELLHRERDKTRSMQDEEH